MIENEGIPDRGRRKLLAFRRRRGTAIRWSARLGETFEYIMTKDEGFIAGGVRCCLKLGFEGIFFIAILIKHVNADILRSGYLIDSLKQSFVLDELEKRHPFNFGFEYMAS